MNGLLEVNLLSRDANIMILRVVRWISLLLDVDSEFNYKNWNAIVHLQR
jgi:hypothetical protein